MAQPAVGPVTRTVVVGVLLMLVGAGCSSDSGAPDADPSRTRTPGPSEPTGSPGATDDPSTGPSLDVLEWKQVPGSVEDTVTVAGPWTLTVPAGRHRAVLTGPDRFTFSAGPRGQVSEALIDGDYALVVVQDRLEQRPATASVVDLADGRRFRLDGGSEVPTTTGGTWALGSGHALYATYDDARRYCVATVDLASEQAEVGWCAEPRHGFSNARISETGDALLTFDAGRPSCRTVVALSGPEVEPFPGVEECRGWEGALLDAGRIWSVVRQERQIDTARFAAAVGSDRVDLGPGVSGSLVVCGGAAYFARDPVAGRPARVLRWTPGDGLSTVYEAAGGARGFVVTPLRCGGDQLTLTALSGAGDVQVTAPLAG